MSELMKPATIDPIDSWRVSAREAVRVAFFQSEHTQTELEEFFEQDGERRHRYIITGVGVYAARSVIGNDSTGVEFLRDISRTDRPSYEVQAEFEQETLGLALGRHPNGLHYQLHRTGFGAGYYPIAPVAEFAGVEVATLHSILHDDIATKFGSVIIKNGAYLLPVGKHYYSMPCSDPSNVYADKVIELSEEGIALMETALTIADVSSRI